MSDTQAPPAPLLTAPAAPETDDESIYLPETPQPIDWTTPSPAADEALAAIQDGSTKARTKAPRRRGLPVGPALAAAGNVTAVTVTSAYQVGGWPGLAGASVTLLGGAAAATARRRASVRRRSSATAGRQGGSGARSGGAQWGAGHSSGQWAASGGPGTSGSRGGTGSLWAPGSRAGGSSAGSTNWGSSPSGARASQAGSNSSGHSPMPGSVSGSVPGGARPGARANLPGHDRRAPGNSTKPGAVERLARIADRLTGGTGRTKPGKQDSPQKKPSRTLAATKRTAALAKRASLATGRGTAKAWKASAPHRRKATAAARRVAARAAGRIWDAIRAGTAGAFTGLRHWDRAKAFERMRQVWHRLRARRAARTAAHNEPSAPEANVIADAARRPTSHNLPLTSPGAAAMSGHHFVASAMEMARAASAYEPTGMMQVGKDFAGLQEALQLTAEAMKISTEKADEKQPLDPRIIEMMRGIYQLQMRAAEMAAELGPAFRNLHQVDITRIENPRKGVAGEAMWDIRANL